MSAVEIENVTKRYGRVVALDSVSLAIESGEILGLVGANGAGKSTLVSLMAGLLRRDGGRIAICGVDPQRETERARRSIGLAAQELAIYPTVSVRENLLLFGELVGLRREGLKQRIDEVCEQLQIVDLLERVASRLSGGQKRRLHTAIALLRPAPVMLLDEPTAGVDVATRQALLGIVRQIARDGAAVCYSTHYLPEVEDLQASIAIIDKGKVLVRSTVDELVSELDESFINIDFENPDTSFAFEGLSFVSDRSVRIATTTPTRTLVDVTSMLHRSGASISNISVSRPTLEAAYLRLISAADGESLPEGSA